MAPAVSAALQFATAMVRIHSSIALQTVDHGHMRLGCEPNVVTRDDRIWLLTASEVLWFIQSKSFIFSARAHACHTNRIFGINFFRTCVSARTVAFKEFLLFSFWKKVISCRIHLGLVALVGVVVVTPTLLFSMHPGTSLHGGSQLVGVSTTSAWQCGCCLWESRAAAEAHDLLDLLFRHTTPPCEQLASCTFGTAPSCPSPD